MINSIKAVYLIPHGIATVCLKKMYRYVTLKLGTVVKPEYFTQHGHKRTGMATKMDCPAASRTSWRTCDADGIAGAPATLGGRAYKTWPAGVSAVSRGSVTDSMVTALEP
jgi:hypothetical protein